MCDFAGQCSFSMFSNDGFVIKNVTGLPCDYRAKFSCVNMNAIEVCCTTKLKMTTAMAKVTQLSYLSRKKEF